MFKLKNSNGKNNCCGENLLRIRSERGLSQRGLSRKLQLAGFDLDNHVIRRVENGER